LGGRKRGSAPFWDGAEPPSPHKAHCTINADSGTPRACGKDCGCEGRALESSGTDRLEAMLQSCDSVPNAMFLSWLMLNCGAIGGSACESALSSPNVRFAHKPKWEDPRRQRLSSYPVAGVAPLKCGKTRLRWEQGEVPATQRPVTHLTASAFVNPYAPGKGWHRRSTLGSSQQSAGVTGGRWRFSFFRPFSTRRLFAFPFTRGRRKSEQVRPLAPDRPASCGRMRIPDSDWRSYAF
jgi:hypothetical protein